MRYTIAVNYPVEPWSTIVSFGTIGNDSKGLEKGIAIGAWEDDIWFGLKPINGQRGLERCLPLDFWVLPSTFAI